MTTPAMGPAATALDIARELEPAVALLGTPRQQQMDPTVLLRPYVEALAGLPRDAVEAAFRASLNGGARFLPPPGVVKGDAITWMRARGWRPPAPGAPDIPAGHCRTCRAPINDALRDRGANPRTVCFCPPTDR